MERVKMRKSGMAIFLLGACVLMLAACGNETEHREKTQHYITETDTRNLLEETEEENGKTGDIQMQKMIVEVSGQRFEADLFDNETVQALRDRLPMTINMEELHGNEKYDYLDEELPSNPENIGSIKTGISCCLALIVLFCFSRTLILLTTTPGLVI
ncbi:cyclophilin-like fold protein [Blautia sp. JLR.GB0024]